MTAPFDIFQAEADGRVLWIESAETLDDAEARIREYAARRPGEYLVLNQLTGTKLRIKAEARAPRQESRGLSNA